MIEAMSSISHIAFSDEANWNQGRYRAISLVTLSVKHLDDITSSIIKLLKESSVAEFKWSKTYGGRDKHAALKLCDLAISLACQKRLRIDVLSWDIEDRRHRIIGRDDKKNLSIMYYNLFRNVLKERWPDDAIWKLCPDENTVLDWVKMHEFLALKEYEFVDQRELVQNKTILDWVKQVFKLHSIEACDSFEKHVIQVADLFAGICIFSRSRYETYLFWQEEKSNQKALDFFADHSELNLSKSDQERCEILKIFNERCKKNKLGVSLAKHCGLRTLHPNNPINFWWYEPQHEADKAPLKN